MWHRWGADACCPSQTNEVVSGQPRTIHMVQQGLASWVCHSASLWVRVFSLGVIQGGSKAIRGSKKEMWKSPCRRPLCSFRLWRSNNHSLLREVYCLGTVQTCLFLLTCTIWLYFSFSEALILAGGVQSNEMALRKCDFFLEFWVCQWDSEHTEINYRCSSAHNGAQQTPLKLL